jgi:biotin transport system substrate-specific component
MTASLAANLWPAARSNILTQLALAVGGSLLLAASAHVQVPFWPVPLTMQTLAVLLIGIVYGPELGAATVLLYLAEGASGLPMFAKGGGIAYLTGPTSGYLVSYPIAAAIVGWMTSGGRGRSFVYALLGCLAAEVVIFALGFGWLATFIGASKAWLAGVQPFLLGDAVKLAIAALISQTAWRQVVR